MLAPCTGVDHGAAGITAALVGQAKLEGRPVNPDEILEQFFTG